ncbi:MAG: hypothetical protein GY708_19450 [Actinomycetia bacterium]|nr:hypothetical protein [Actinomycetes bacterium]MCP4961652.1 hypothetical protein [Actinomycetes bacterium]
MSGLEDLIERFSIHAADSPDELRRHLCLYSRWTKSADSFEPVSLFKKHHTEEPDTAMQTALLLATSDRWSNASGKIMTEIEQTGFIRDNLLDALATAFIDAGTHIYWQMPDEWFDEPQFTIGLTHDDGCPRIESATTDDSMALEEEPDPAVIECTVRPPLRRWAARFLMGRESRAWPAMYERATADDIPARDRAFIVKGLVDGADELDDDARTILLGLAARWPDKRLRVRARDLLDRSNDPGTASPDSPGPGGDTHEDGLGTAGANDKKPNEADDGGQATLF